MPPSELGTRLTARDWAYFHLWWDRYGTFEPLVIPDHQPPAR